MENAADSVVPAQGLSPNQWVKLHKLSNPETVRQLLEVYEGVRGVSVRPSPGAGRLIFTEVSVLLVETFHEAERRRVKPEVVWRERLSGSQQPKDELAVAARAEVGQFKFELLAATRVLFDGLSTEYGRRVERDTELLMQEGQRRLMTLEAGRVGQLEVLDVQFEERLEWLEAEHRRRLQGVVEVYEAQRLELRRVSGSVDTMLEVCRELRLERDALTAAVAAVAQAQKPLEGVHSQIKVQLELAGNQVREAGRLHDALPNQKLEALVGMSITFVVGVGGCLAAMRVLFKSRAMDWELFVVFLVAVGLAGLWVMLRLWLAERFGRP